MAILTYKCPACGAPLNYDGVSRKLRCGACANEFEAEALDALHQADQDAAAPGSMDWDMSGEAYDSGSTRTYVCESCGAELVTDETTAATECAYCGNPIVLTEQLSGGTRPKFVLPFRVSEEQARKLFHDYFRKKHLIPNIFTESQNRISEIRKLYVPYWLFSCRAEADVTYNATRVTVRTIGDRQETRTRHYLICRSGTLDFENIPVDGSEKLDDRITESLEPFDFSEAIEFLPATLSGSLADKADVDPEVCRERANTRLRASTEDAFRSTVVGYNTVLTRSASIRVDGGNGVPVLLPVWFIRTKKTVRGKEQFFTFAINGQTGKLTCDVPWSKPKAAKWFFGLTAAITAGGYLLMLILALTGVIGGGM